MPRSQSNRAFPHILFSLFLPVLARLFHRRRFTRERRLLSSLVRVPEGWVTCALKPWHRSSPNTFREIRLSLFSICLGAAAERQPIIFTTPPAPTVSRCSVFLAASCPMPS